MDSNPLLRKWLAIGILVILMGIAIFPSLTAHISKDNFITVNIKTSNTFDSESYNVSLSMQEYEHLEEVMTNIEFNLKNCVSIDEAKLIFNESIVEFYNLGLLGDMSLEKAQMFVTEGQDKTVEKCIEKLNNNNLLNEEVNCICLTAGSSNQTFMIAPVNTIVTIFVLPFYLFIPFKMLKFLCLLAMQVPAGGLGIILNGRTQESDHGYNRPSCGWTFSIGLNGVRFHNGSFQGDLYDFVDSQENSAIIIHCSIVGFVGFIITTLTEMFHIGGAALYKTESIET